MVCLERFYEETGLSRTMLAEASGVSVDSLRKYEWSDTDRMRSKTIDKIEAAVAKLTAVNLRVYHVAFGGKWVLQWDNPDRRITKNEWRITIGILQSIIEGA